MTARDAENVPLTAENREIALEIAGTAVRLVFGPGLEAVAEEIAELWEHLRASDIAAPAQIQLEYGLVGSELAAGTIPLRAQPSATYAVSGHITREVIRSLIGTRLLLHAAAVAHPELGTVLLIGASGAGKSTAASHLGRAGRYLTDELTILDPDGFALTPYPKPVSKHDPALGTKRDLALPDLDLAPSPAGPGGEASPSVVLLLDRIRDEQAGEPEPPGVSRVRLPEALSRIVPQTSSLWAVSGGLARLAELLDSVGGALEVRYREASELEGLLRELPPAEHAPVAELEPPGADSGEDAAEAGGLCVAPFRQALAVDAGVFVLGEEQGAIYLPGLAGLVWDLLLATGPLGLEELEELVVQEIGEHPDSAEMVRAVVEDLVARGWARQG